MHAQRKESSVSSVDKAFADNIVSHGGWYNGDADNSLGDNPRCVLIIEYTNSWGTKAYGLVFEGKINKYKPSKFVINPQVYWKAGKIDPTTITKWSAAG